MRYIYVIGNCVNWKVYVGQTKDPVRRKAGHWAYARRGTQTHLYDSMRKHGVENFTFLLLEECEDSQIDERERHWIVHFDSMNPLRGYNRESGGRKEKDPSEETRRKMSDRAKQRRGHETSMWGKHHRDESKLKSSLSQKGRVLTKEHREKLRIAFLGRSLSESHKQKIGDAHRGKTTRERTRQLMSDAAKEFKNRIVIATSENETREFEDVYVASRTLNLRVDRIVSCARGIMKKHGGFQWNWQS